MSAHERSPIGPGGGHAGAWSLGERPNVSRSEQQRRLSVDARGIWSKLLRVGANLHGESGKGSAAVVRFSSSTCWLSRHRRVRRSFLTMMPGRQRCRRDNRVPDPQPRAAHRFTPLTFGQADDKPPSSVQDRKRAEHDKKKSVVHVWINIVVGDRPSTRSNDAAALIYAGQSLEGWKWRPVDCPYSITSSARASSDCGTVRPSALAVFMLMTIKYFVGC
jgi:hypothetical protein